MASKISGVSIVCSTVCWGPGQRKHQSPAWLAFVRKGIHVWPVNSPHNGTVTRKMFPFDDVIMWTMRKALCIQGLAFEKLVHKMSYVLLSPNLLNSTGIHIQQRCASWWANSLYGRYNNTVSCYHVRDRVTLLNDTLFICENQYFVLSSMQNRVRALSTRGNRSSQ